MRRTIRTNHTCPGNSAGGPALSAGGLAMPRRPNDGDAIRAAVKSGEAILLVDESVYSRDVLLRTCYWFTDRCYLFVSRAGTGVFSVRIRAKAGGTALDTISGEF